MTTKVIFKKFNNGDKEVIAFFPEIPGNNDAYSTCTCYQHIGQHGIASLDFAADCTPAKEEEYKDLLTELVSIGYDDLKISRKFTQKDLQKRLDACKV